MAKTHLLLIVWNLVCPFKLLSNDHFLDGQPLYLSDGFVNRHIQYKCTSGGFFLYIKRLYQVL